MREPRRPPLNAPTAPPSTSPIDTDALVIGAGPVGLFLVFELGLLGLSAQVVDALPHPGGQCSELYADKPIYDIPGLPMVSGRGLVDRLLAQAAPFKPRFHLGQQVDALAPGADGRWQACTGHGTRFDARCVFIAAGTGAFVPRSVALPGLPAHVGRQVHYRLEDARTLAGQRVVVLGDEDPALAQVIDLAALPEGDRPARISLLHRRDQFRADESLVRRFNALRAQGAVHFQAGQPTGLVSDDSGRLVALELLPPTGASEVLPTDNLLIRMGLSPRLGPLAEWGMAMERKQLLVDTARFETSLAGVYAVGDINTYPGKRKLLLCGFHEATLAAFAAAERLRGQPVALQYTTTSPRLHQLLGVTGAAADDGVHS